MQDLFLVATKMGTMNGLEPTNSGTRLTLLKGNTLKWDMTKSRLTKKALDFIRKEKEEKRTYRIVEPNIYLK